MTWLDPPTQVCTPWITDLCCSATADPPEAEVTAAVLWASNELWFATGQRIGLCEQTVHACPRRCWDLGWNWNCWCVDCPPYDVIDLGPQYVTEVTAVTINGNPLTKNTDWIVLDWRWLARLTGSWPDTGTVIQYTAGTPPNVSAQRAVEILACEFLRSKRGDKNCRLARERSARRDGRFEIPEVDAWVSLQNREDDCGVFDPATTQSFYQVTSGT